MCSFVEKVRIPERAERQKKKNTLVEEQNLKNDVAEYKDEQVRSILLSQTLARSTSVSG